MTSIPLKLNKRLRADWVAKILAHEFGATNFTGLREEVWAEYERNLVPVGVAELLRNESTRDWVNTTKLLALRKEAEAQIRRAKTLSEGLRKLRDGLDRVAAAEAKSLDAIHAARAKLEAIAASVSTVAGLKKLSPDYAHFLPTAKPREVDASQLAQTLATAKSEHNKALAAAKTLKPRRPRPISTTPRKSAR